MEHFKRQAFATLNFVKRIGQVLLGTWIILLTIGLSAADASEPFFFIQLTDPQFGLYAKNENFQQESANFELVIATANRLRPAFVIVTGDLVQKPGDNAQEDEYLRIAAKLDRSIPLYNVPGNHDVANDPTPQRIAADRRRPEDMIRFGAGGAPTPESIAAYKLRFGPDYYAFRQGPMLGLVLDSNLILSSSSDLAEEVGKQQSWLKTRLEKAHAEGAHPVIVFQHHPWFINNVDEPDSYFNMPLLQRRRYLDLMRSYGVSHIFAGHYHANQIAQYDGLEMVTTGSLGRPRLKDVSGLRVVIVRDTGIEHRYYHLGEIPNQIDLRMVVK